jgi:hypothetical protein
MPIEVRFKEHDGKWLGDCVISCHYCGEDIETLEEGVAMWMPELQDSPGMIHVAEYAHEDCENYFLSKELPTGCANGVGDFTGFASTPRLDSSWTCCAEGRL